MPVCVAYCLCCAMCMCVALCVLYVHVCVTFCGWDWRRFHFSGEEALKGVEKSLSVALFACLPHALYYSFLPFLPHCCLPLPPSPPAPPKFAVTCGIPCLYHYFLPLPVPSPSAWQPKQAGLVYFSLPTSHLSGNLHCITVPLREEGK